MDGGDKVYRRQGDEHCNGNNIYNRTLGTWGRGVAKLEHEDKHYNYHDSGSLPRVHFLQDNNGQLGYEKLTLINNGGWTEYRCGSWHGGWAEYQCGEMVGVD